MDKKKKPDPETDPRLEADDSADQVQDIAEDTAGDDLAEPDNAPDSPVADDAAVETDQPDNAEQVDEAEIAETVTEPPAEEAPAEPVPQVQHVVEKKGGFGSALIGGILAAGLGFAAARTEILDPYLPQSWQAGKTDAAIATLQASIADHTAALAALQSDLGAIKVPDLAPIQAQLGAIEAEIAPLRDETAAIGTRFADLDARLATLDSRLSEVEKRPMTDSVSQAAIAAYERELTALQQSMATQRTEVEALIDNARSIKAQAQEMEANAAKAAQQAASRAIVTRLRGALDDGAPIAPMLAELASAGVSVPSELTSVADTGVATHAALSAAFVPAARAALAAAREQDEGGGLGGFLQRQLGARSVVPREGDDPDAILSRAEATLTNGDLPQALKEISTLPDIARAKMNDWVTLATTRATALNAADTLAQSLNAN